MSCNYISAEQRGSEKVTLLGGANAKGLIIFETELDLVFPRITGNNCSHNHEIIAHYVIFNPIVY